MTIFVCPWKCGLRLMSSGLIPKSEMRGFWGSWCYFILHIEGNFGCLSCCQFICLHEISSHHQGSEQFGLSKVLDEHEDLIISPLTEDSQGKKKKLFKEKLSKWEFMVLTLNSVSSGMAFPAPGKKALFSGTQFPNPRKSQTQPATCTGCRKAEIPMQNTGNFMHRMDILLCLLSWNQGACWRPDSS